MKKLSIIILTYNSEKDIYACIESIYIHNDIDDYLEIIIVDNNSMHFREMQRQIEQLYPDVKIIANNKNGGYGQGNNIGIKAATAPIVAIMNPDVRLVMPIFQTFLTEFANEQVIMCGGKQYATPTHANASFYYDFTECGFLQSIGRIICHKFDIYNQKRMWLQGAFFFIKKHEFEQIGLFDEHIFMYSEEFDIHTRIKKYYPNKKIKYLKNAKYLHLTADRILTADTLKKQYEANVYVCIKNQLSLQKMIKQTTIALFFNRIVSILMGCKKSSCKIQYDIITSIKKQYKL